MTPDSQERSDELGSALLKAAMLQDANEARRLLAAGAPPDVFNVLDHTPLIIASATGNIDLAKALIEGKADPNVVTEKGATALVAAKTAQMMQFLLDNGADPFAVDPGFYALLLRRSAQLGVGGMFQTLADGGAASGPDDAGKTILMYAAEGNCPAIVDEALKTCANVNEQDKNRISALIHASMAGSGDAAEVLLKAGAKADDEFNGITALAYMAKKGSVAGVKALLKNGAKPNSRDRDDNNAPLRMAIEGGRIDCVRLLLEAGADPLNKGYDQEKKLYTSDEDLAFKLNPAIAAIVSEAARPFHISGAAAAGDTQRVSELLDAGVEVDFVNRRGETALLRACEAGKTDTVKFLLSRGANANYKNPETDMTPLLEAMKHDDPFLFEALLKAGAKTDELSKDGEPPLFAVLEKPVKFVDILLQYGADPNYAPTSDGRTAIYRAIVMEDISLVEHLIAGGARASVKDNDGVSAVEFAANSEKSAIVSAVREQYQRELEEIARAATSLGGSVNPLKAIKFRGPKTP